MQNKAPDWILKNEAYTPERDRDSFIDKSIKALASVLSKIRHATPSGTDSNINTAVRLFGIAVCIILTSASRNFYFVFIMCVAATVCLAISDGKIIRGVLKVLLPVILFTIIILLPAFIAGNKQIIASICARIYVSVTLVIRMSLTTEFNRITSALKHFHIPDIIILTLDTAIHYIFVLGELCFVMLTALKVRSIGKSKDKRNALSGIMGTAFLKARENTILKSQAMECRGFDGSYAVSTDRHFGKFDFLYCIIIAIITGIFIYFQVVIK